MEAHAPLLLCVEPWRHRPHQCHQLRQLKLPAAVAVEMAESVPQGHTLVPQRCAELFEDGLQLRRGLTLGRGHQTGPLIPEGLHCAQQLLHRHLPVTVQVHHCPEVPGLDFRGLW